MAFPWEKAKEEAAQQSGMEKMLRSMGLGEVLDMAKQLANAGTAQKIIAFADNLEPLMQRLERVEEMLARIDREVSGRLITEPDTSARQPEPERTADSRFVREPVTNGSFQGSGGNGALHPDDGDVHSGTETPVG